MQPQGDEGESRLLVLVQNHQGYLNLSEILARAWTQPLGKTQTQAQVAWAWLQELHAGLIVLSGAHTGLVGQALLRGDAATASRHALALAEMFPHRFYLELQRAGRAEDEALVAQTVELAARLQLPVVATQPIQFLRPDDFQAHEARVCIAEGEVLANAKRPRRFTQEQYFKNSLQMQELFADIPSALENTLEIARRCSLA